MTATEIALNNPLIDDYSLKGAKGLLVNITGGKDITLFEVEESVNKIRAEVDPDAELIFGAIKDENMSGRMRVSIVATALDGHQPESKTILNMVNRIQNRNPGYSENLFSKNNHIENNTFNSINGATALKLDEQYEVEHKNEEPIANLEPEQSSTEGFAEQTEEISSGVSIESATYMENSLSEDNSMAQEVNQESSMIEKSVLEEEHTPQLFSNENDMSIKDSQNLENNIDTEMEKNENLFDQNNDEEDFEIPAFLRRQKF
jgi:cell division protein FtsZ